uniref:CSON012555 protein n=1 Tax=Culicoides sonorensis TaxID=179676 RepID=A0A336LH52_CULSO
MRDKLTVGLYIFIYVFSGNFFLISRTTTLLRLDPRTNGIISHDNYVPTEDVSSMSSESQLHEEVFHIICNGRVSNQKLVNNGSMYDLHDSGMLGYQTSPDETSSIDSEVLDCGKPVNFTYYDDLIGVAQRFTHPIVPEPEVSYIFFNSKKDTNSQKTFDIDALERRLKKAKREKPKSVQLYNQIGNFWRIKGDVRQSIECFRRALAVSPTNAEVLLNLARVLFNLQFLDDAIYLTRRSLEVQPPDKSPWKQYLTLGEIFKAYGHFQESQIHLRHALELMPDHIGIKQALLDVENIPSSTLHAYTILIILFLAMGVLLLVVSSTESSQLSEMSDKRHLNRMLFRQHKVFRNIKCRKNINVL